MAGETGAQQLQPWELAQRQSLPLEQKVVLTLQRIKDWHEHWEGNVSVSVSGGKDSAVLLHLVRRRYSEVPAVFADTGLEYPEVRAFALSVPGVNVVRPRMPFGRVLAEYGYPVVSKEVARFIRDLRKPKHVNPNTQRLRLTGFNRAGRYCPSMRLPKKWYFLIRAPFPISEQCCDVMKKEPLVAATRDYGYPFVGTMAGDSLRRRRNYMRFGCNQYTARYPLATPLGIWTDQDILEYIRTRGLQIASVYGEIVETPDGLDLTGVRHTGCMFCMFGVHREEEPNRFQQMAETHPRLYRYCIDRLRVGEVLDFMGVPY